MKIHGVEMVELSGREMECVLLALNGKTDREIAVKIDRSIHSVEKFLTRAYQKLGISRIQNPIGNPRMKLYAMVQDHESNLSKQIHARLEVLGVSV